MKKNYEVMFILKPEADLHLETDKFKKLIADNGGMVKKVDVWGKKRLAYCINDTDEGLYALVSFVAPHACVIELDRVMKITSDVLRYMIISKGE